MELKGTLKQLNAIIQRTESFKVRTAWIVTMDNPKFPQTIEVQLQQDKVNMFDGITIGAPLILQCNLRGVEYTKDGKTSVFNSIVCWQVKADAVVAGNAMDHTTALPGLDDSLGF